ncbi:MAG TPA: (d)CMP kinase [Spirochaetia bacterium]|nr:(d)CMP kinase [Spirochaetia bacterium]
MVVALDGPAGVGKSSVSRQLASKTGMCYINSGNFYRAITLLAIERGVDLSDENAVTQLAEENPIDIKDGRICIAGRDVEDELHTDTVDAHVAELSRIPSVREVVNRRLKELAKTRDVIVEGRDITTVVFPDAEVKVYLDANPKTRALRRYRQGVSNLSLEEIEANIRKRDDIDTNKPIGSLKISSDALYLDTSDLTIDEVCEKVLKKINTFLHPGR